MGRLRADASRERTERPMDPTEILRVVVPLVVMAVWALSFLFNREAAPPARQPRPEGEIELTKEGRFDEIEPMGSRAEYPPGGGRTLPRPIEIQSRFRPNSVARRIAGRGRSTSGSEKGRGDSKSSRPLRGLSDEVSLTQSVARSMEQAQKEMSGGTMSPARIDLSRDTSHSSQSRATAQSNTSSPFDSLRSPARLRELFVLQEVLGRPVSRRRPGGRGPGRS